MILGIDFGDDLVHHVAVAWLKFLRRDGNVFNIADFSTNRFGVVVPEINFRIFDGLFDDLLRVGHVVDRKILLQSDHRRVDSEKPRTKTMERPRPSKIVGRQQRQTFPHLVGGFISERQRHDFLRRDPLGNHVGDAVRNDARLARTRTGHDQ